MKADKVNGIRIGVAAVLAAWLAACGGGAGTEAAAPPAKVAIGGTVSGLATGMGTSGLVLVLNGDAATATPIDQNGSFTLGPTLAPGANYSVTVRSQPAGQECVVGSGSGAVPASGAAVAGITVTCTAVDTRALQISLNVSPNAPSGVLMPYYAAEQQGIPLTRMDWYFDGVPGGRRPTGMPSLSSVTLAQGGEFMLQVWNRPGPHTVRVVATASNGRMTEATATVNVASNPLAAGAGHSCAITSAGGVKCWGWGHEWQLGNGSQNDQASPVDVPGLAGVVGLAAGSTFTCALKATGTVVCWGDGNTGVTGPTANYASSLTPVSVSGLTNVVALSAGRYHVCALKDDGSVACWGANEAGQLGTGVSAAKTFTPTPVAGLGKVVSIASGNSFNCAITAIATVACWGNNASGQLGVDARTPMAAGEVQSVNWSLGVTGVLSQAISLSLGSDHACAIVDTAGTGSGGGGLATLCWGNNGNGQTGHTGAAASSPSVAFPVAGQTGTLMLSSGSYNSCSQDFDMVFRCWGSNGYGESDGTGAAAYDVLQPTVVPGLQGLNAPDFAAGGNEFLCALIDDGTARCVGRGGSGQIGNGVAADAKTVQTVNAPAGTFWNLAGNGRR